MSSIIKQNNWIKLFTSTAFNSSWRAMRDSAVGMSVPDISNLEEWYDKGSFIGEHGGNPSVQSGNATTAPDGTVWISGDSSYTRDYTAATGDTFGGFTIFVSANAHESGLFMDRSFRDRINVLGDGTVYFRKQYATFTTSDIGVGFNEWHSYVMRKNRDTNDMSAFVDAVNVGSVNGSGSETGANYLEFGDGVNVQLKERSYWLTELTDAEIKWLHNDGVSRTYQELVDAQGVSSEKFGENLRVFSELSAAPKFCQKLGEFTTGGNTVLTTNITLEEGTGINPTLLVITQTNKNIASVTDSAGNTYSQVYEYLGGTINIRFWKSDTTLSLKKGELVTVNWTSSSYDSRRISVLELSNVGGVLSTLSGSSYTTNGGGVPIVTGPTLSIGATHWGNNTGGALWGKTTNGNTELLPYSVGAKTYQEYYSMDFQDNPTVGFFHVSSTTTTRGVVTFGPSDVSKTKTFAQLCGQDESPYVVAEDFADDTFPSDWINNGPIKVTVTGNELKCVEDTSAYAEIPLPEAEETWIYFKRRGDGISTRTNLRLLFIKDELDVTIGYVGFDYNGSDNDVWLNTNGETVYARNSMDSTERYYWLRIVKDSHIEMWVSTTTERCPINILSEDTDPRHIKTSTITLGNISKLQLCGWGGNGGRASYFDDILISTKPIDDNPELIKPIS